MLFLNFPSDFKNLKLNLGVQNIAHFGLFIHLITSKHPQLFNSNSTTDFTRPECQFDEGAWECTNCHSVHFLSSERFIYNDFSKVFLFVTGYADANCDRACSIVLNVNHAHKLNL